MDIHGAFCGQQLYCKLTGTLVNVLQVDVNFTPKYVVLFPTLGYASKLPEVFPSLELFEEAPEGITSQQLKAFVKSQLPRVPELDPMHEAVVAMLVAVRDKTLHVASAHINDVSLRTLVRIHCEDEK